MREKVLLRNILSGVAVTALALALGVVIAAYQEEHLSARLSEKVLRFHVLANSDSDEDQALKLQVRDAVGVYMQDVLRDADSLEESRNAASCHLEEIRNVAELVIAREGYDYPVSAALEETEFPDKSYGPYTLPGGTYQALRIVIGAGEGQNWWCVMYPNMCFAGSVYQVTEDAQEKLYQVLTLHEYRRLIESDDREYRLKFADDLLGRKQ